MPSIFLLGKKHRRSIELLLSLKSIKNVTTHILGWLLSKRKEGREGGRQASKQEKKKKEGRGAPGWLSQLSIQGPDFGSGDDLRVVRSSHGACLRFSLSHSLCPPAWLAHTLSLKQKQTKKTTTTKHTYTQIHLMQ